MNRVALALTVLAGACASASAVVNTHIDVLVSTDGVNYSHQVFPAGPGDTVQVLISVSYIGTGSPLGLASMVFQPTVSSFDATNTTEPFFNGGAGGNNSSPPGTISDSPGQYGRITPWGRSGLTSSTALTYFNNTSVGQPAGGWLRIAQRQVTAWIGGAGNTSGGSGVGIAQLSNVGRTASDPAFSPQLTNIHVFRFGFTLGPNFAGNTIVDLPAAGFGNRNSATGDREVYWFADMNEAVGSIRGTAEVVPAVLHLPGPGAMLPFGLAGLAAARRRR